MLVALIILNNMAEQQQDMFGNASLFDDFFDEPVPKQEVEKINEQQDETSVQLRETIDELRQEIGKLRQQVRLLIQPGCLEGCSTRSEGPVAQVLYFDHDAVCIHRQKIEDFFEELTSLKDEDLEMSEEARPRPQRSSRPLQRDLENQSMHTVTGNVQYHQRFCLDSMGRPLVNGNPQLTEGWDIPVYPVIFHEALPIDETERPNQQKQKRSKPTCWNCGNEDHSLRDCPLPRDMVKIGIAKKEFMEHNEENAMKNKRYHKDEAADQRFANFTPGQLSNSLREALGLDEKQVPPYIFQMRSLGYPPGYLKQAEVLQSGLTVYDTKGEVGNEPGEINRAVDAPIKYDPSKLIDYPGFNVPLPEGVREPGDVLPMQAAHSKDAFQMFMTPPRGSGSERKRGRNFHEDPEKKRPRMSSSSERDMDVVEDSSDSSFKPPLPPTPILETPPPLPTSTPPITPGHTPRFMQADTPSEFPPAEGVDDRATPDPDSETVSQSSASQDTSRSASPSIDDLELMQRRLEEALLQASEEGSNLVCDTESSNERFLVNGEEFIVDSVGEDDNTTNDETVEDPSQAAEDGSESSTLPSETTLGDNKHGSVLNSQNSELTNEVMQDSLTAEDSFVVVDSAEDNKSQAPSLDMSTANPESPTSITEKHETTIQTENVDTAGVANMEPGQIMDSDLDATPNRSGVPHLSKFAVGISPHENENLSQSTGMLKRIMSIFKKKDKGKTSQL